MQAQRVAGKDVALAAYLEANDFDMVLTAQEDWHNVPAGCVHSSPDSSVWMMMMNRYIPDWSMEKAEQHMLVIAFQRTEYSCRNPLSNVSNCTPAKYPGKGTGMCAAQRHARCTYSLGCYAGTR